MEKDIIQKQNEQEIASISTTNLYEIIEDIRKHLLEKRNSYISNTKSINPFNEIKPLSINDFERELVKYNISVDRSYIEGTISQINIELQRRLVIKTKQNLLQNIITSSTDVIELLTKKDLIQNYGINIDSTNMREILEYVNNGIKFENIKRKKTKKFERLSECFVELAGTDIQKDAIEQIMKTGEYNGFKLNSMLSNKKNDENIEMKRRIDFAEIVLHDEKLFFYLVNNGLNVFHGTKIDALETILSKGLISSSELNEYGIQLKTGEEEAMNRALGQQGQKRNFISLTDHFDTAATKYAGFPFDESIEYSKELFGKDITSDKDIPIMICFNGKEIEQKYSESLITINSDVAEIGVNTSIDQSDIKCIITSHDKIEYVKSIASKYGIDVLGYNNNDKYEKRFYDKEGKFYSPSMEIDEQEFKRTKDKLKTARINHSNLGNNHSINETQNTEHLSEELSMKIASDMKMNIVFSLIEQYNNGTPIAPVTINDLIAKYNMNENVAQRLASDINTMFENYKQEEERQKKNYTPYVLDGFDEEINSTGGKSR